MIQSHRNPVIAAFDHSREALRQDIDFTFLISLDPDNATVVMKSSCIPLPYICVFLDVFKKLIFNGTIMGSYLKITFMLHNRHKSPDGKDIEKRGEQTLASAENPDLGKSIVPVAGA